jgi:predicted GNAT family acetyltransferase
VQSDAPDPDPALASLAGYLYEQGAILPGVNGPDPLSAIFARHWSRLTGVSHRQKMALRVFELRQVQWPADPPGGRLRPVHRNAAAILSDWIFEFRREALEKEGEGEREWAEGRAERALKEGGVYFWDDDGPVSLVSRARSTPRGATVNMVYTPPRFRNRGYASMAVATLSQRLLEAGYDFCTLFTDLANPTSNHIYQAIGYRRVCDFAEITFEA